MASLHICRLCDNNKVNFTLLQASGTKYFVFEVQQSSLELEI